MWISNVEILKDIKGYIRDILVEKQLDIYVDIFVGYKRIYWDIIG